MFIFETKSTKNQENQQIWKRQYIEHQSGAPIIVSIPHCPSGSAKY